MKQSRTGRRIRQMMPAAPGMCVAIAYDNTVQHRPLIAWVLIEDDQDVKRFGIGSDQNLMPVYLDDGGAHIVWPSTGIWQDGRVDIHYTDRCVDATRVLREVMAILFDSDPAVTP